MPAITEDVIKPQESVQRSWTILRVLIGIILLTASCMKAHMLATTPMLGDDILHSRWFNILVVQFEMFFGIWLLVGLMPKLTGLASIVCFTIFAAVSGYKAVTGESSCGCWGNIDVSPWYTMIFDLFAIGLLAWFRPKGIVFQWKAFLNEMPELKRFKCVGIVTTIWVILAVPVAWAMITAEFVTLVPKSLLTKNEKNVVLKPFQWIDTEFPLLPYIDDSSRAKLIIDRKTVVLFRFDCKECKQLIEKLSNKNEYVFIAIPSTEDNPEIFSMPEYSMLSDQYEWWVETPVFFELENGIVKNVSREPNKT